MKAGKCLGMRSLGVYFLSSNIFLIFYPIFRRHLPVILSSWAACSGVIGMNKNKLKLSYQRLYNFYDFQNLHIKQHHLLIIFFFELRCSVDSSLFNLALDALLDFEFFRSKPLFFACSISSLFLSSMCTSIFLLIYFLNFLKVSSTLSSFYLLPLSFICPTTALAFPGSTITNS